MEATNHSSAQAPIFHSLVLLYPTVFLFLVVKFLEIKGREFFQLDLTDVRRDVMLNVTAIVWTK